MGRKLDVGSLLETFEREIEKFNPHTSRMYKWAVREYLKTGKEFNTQNIREFLEKAKTKNTYNVYASALKWFYKINAEAFDKAGVKIYFESIIPPQLESTFNPTVVPKEEIRVIIDNAPSPLKSVMLETGYELCLRVRELVSLREEDYNPEKGTMYIKALKKGISREMPIPDSLNKKLQEYLKLKHKVWGEINPFFLTEWGNRWFPQNFSHKFFTKYVKRLYNQKLISVVPAYHDFARHSRITHWLQEGVDFFTVNTLARHRRFETTLRYIHLAPEDVVKMLPTDIKKKFGIFS